MIIHNVSPKETPVNIIWWKAKLTFQAAVFGIKIYFCHFFGHI